MNEAFFKQVIAELMHGFGEALGLLTIAIAKQVDASQLALELQTLVAVADHAGSLSPTALSLCNEMIVAAEAEQMLQRPEKH